MAVSPAGGSEGGPEVAVKTPLTRLAVIEEKAVRTRHPIVMQIVDYGDVEAESSLIDGRRETWKNIVNLPKIETTDLLILRKPTSYRKIIECQERSDNFIRYAGPEKVFR